MLRLPGPTGFRQHDGWMHAYFRGVPLAGVCSAHVESIGPQIAAHDSLVNIAARWGGGLAQAISEGIYLNFESARRRLDPVYDGKLRRMPEGPDVFIGFDR